ncbi:MAG: hypothetical protein WCE87_10725 [Candidatus Udaeobacter sp.]
MFLEHEKAARIQELLKKLSTADTFQSVAITREIKEIATEPPEQKHERIQRPESQLKIIGQPKVE